MPNLNDGQSERKRDIYKRLASHVPRFKENEKLREYVLDSATNK